MNIKIQLEDPMGKTIEITQSITLESPLRSIADVEQLVLSIRKTMLPEVEKALLTQVQSAFKGEKNPEEERHQASWNPHPERVLLHAGSRLPTGRWAGARLPFTQ